MTSLAWNMRRASGMHLDGILAVQRACTEAPQWSVEVWRTILAAPEIDEHARVCFIAEKNSATAGFVVVSCACGVAELESVAVGCDARREGVGRALCREAMSWARAREARAIELEVRASSLGAIALYRSLGFVERGRRCGYYRQPTEDALLLCAALDT